MIHSMSSQIIPKKKVLSERQLQRVKLFKLSLMILTGVILAGIVTFQGAMAATTYYYDGQMYEMQQITNFKRGRIVEYTSLEEFCSR